MAFFALIGAKRWFASTCTLALVACASGPSSVQVRTDGRLRVLPGEFTSAVGCRFASGDAAELSHYVATLVDLGVSPEADTVGHTHERTDYPREAGSGVAARCTSTTTFSTAASDDSIIEVDHLYVAIVDGFAGNEPPDVEGQRSVTRWAAPAWQWLCGIGGLDETQLEWLIARAQRLPTKAPVAPTPARDDGGASHPGSAPDAAVSTHDAAVNAPDAAISTHDASPGPGASTSGATASFTSSVRVSDAGNASAVSSSVTAQPETDDAAASTTEGEALPDAGMRDWRSELMRAAASGEFAPPPAVVPGGQSGVRGCVPLF